MLDSFHLLIGINVKMKWRNSVWHLYESGNLEIFEEVAWDGTTHFLTFISLTLCFCWCFEAIFSGLWCENKGTKWCQERGAGSNTSQVSVWIRRASETCTEDFHVCSQQKKLRRVATTRSNRTELAKNEICGQLIFERHHYICQLNSGRNTLFADF